MAADCPPLVRGFAERLHDAVVGAGVALVSTVVHGSAALGGWLPARSDVDVLMIAEGERVSGRALASAASCVHGLAGTSPGRGVELSIVGEALARHPAAPWPFLLHVTTAAPDIRTVIGHGHPGDPDLLLHLAVAHAAGIAVRGRTASEVIATIDRARVLAAILAELAWAQDQADPVYLALNACRAWRYAVTDELVSKHDGATWAMANGASRRTVERALAAQAGEAEPPSAAAVAVLVERARSELARSDVERPGPGV